MNREEIIKNLIDFIGTDTSKKNVESVMKSLTEDIIKECSTSENSIICIKPFVDEIFKLCPKCNFIPLVYEYNDYSNLKKSKSFDNLTEFISEELLKSTHYIPPYEEDDMKIRDVKKMYKLWKEAVDKCWIQEGVEVDYCDYTEETFYSVYGYSKATDKIEYVEIN